jgi:tetratricopeptide (TPR) repeat protein
MRRILSRGSGLAGLLLLFIAVWPPAASADEARDVYKKAIHGVALVQVRVATNSTSQGTGWVVDRAKKLLVTNQHVVENADLVNVIFPAFRDDKARRNGRPNSSKEDYRNTLGLSGRVVDTDVDRDLAIIQLEVLPEGTRELKLASESAGPGDRIHSIGNPAASDALWVNTEGSVRQVYRKQWSNKNALSNRFVSRNAWVIETQSATNPGDSGGPVLNDQGEIVGVVQGFMGMYRGQLVNAMNWSIDVREVQMFLEQTRRLLEPRTAADYALRGERAMKRGRRSQAAEDFTAAIRLDSKCAAAYRNRGVLLAQNKDAETALADFSRAIELQPDDATAYAERGSVYWNKGKSHWDKALADYTKAIQINPKYAAAYNDRALIHWNQGNHQAAFADINRAIDSNPNLSVAYQNRADFYRSKGQVKNAFQDYDRAFTIQPTAYCLQQAAVSAIDLGDNQLAAKLSVVLIRDFKVDTAVPYRIQGLSYQNLREYRLAIASYSEAIRRDAKYAWTYFQRGQMYERLGDFRALADYDKAVELDPKWAAQLKIHKRRYLRIVNGYDEPVKVHLQYEALTDTNEWQWYPGAPEEGQDLTLSVEPGKSAYAFDKDYKIHGRRIRIWADALSSGRQITTHKNKDIFLCAKEYRSIKEMDFTYTFGSPPNPNLVPAHGSVRLTAGFLPDPFVKNLTAGGPTTTKLGGVNSHVGGTPSFKLEYTAGKFPLTIYVESAADTTLLINLPDGRWLADDSSGGQLNPLLRLASPQSGSYAIWVGTVGTATAPAVLKITELK